MPYQLPDLGYAYDALEPHIDAKTMEIHHSKHHSGYTAKLNAAVEGTGLDGTPIVTLLTQMDMGNAALRNNAGGYYNHDLFWKVISPNNRGSLSGALKSAIEASFGSYIIFNALLTNTVIQFVIQFIFIIFLSFVIQLFKYQLSSFMTYQESLTFIIWMMTLPAVLSVVIAFIEPVFASVIYQFMVGIVIMIVMLKYGRKYYR